MAKRVVMGTVKDIPGIKMRKGGTISLESETVDIRGYKKIIIIGGSSKESAVVLYDGPAYDGWSLNDYMEAGIDGLHD